MILRERKGMFVPYAWSDGAGTGFTYFPPEIGKSGELYDERGNIDDPPIAYPATLAEARKILTDAGHTIKENAG